MMTSDVEETSPEPDLHLKLLDEDQDQDDGIDIDIDDIMAESAHKGSANKTESNASSDQLAHTSHGKSNAKDPQRPRRKKARRACHACQRAHLTCGDERPCQRCIKRGLQDACQDGVRKKAKYLHDAPPEALIPPGLGGGYHLNGSQLSSESQADPPLTQASLSQQATYYTPTRPQGLEMFPNQPQMQHSLQSPSVTSYGPPHTQTTAYSSSQQAPQMALSQDAVSQPSQQQYAFDPSDPAFFNFDISSLNFGNHYGALEFGMLGHMSSGANDVNGQDIITPIGQVQNPFNSNYPDQSLLFGQDAMLNADWNAQRQNPSSQPLLQTPHNTPIVTSIDRLDGVAVPHSYTIGARPNSLASASPISTTQDGANQAENAPSPLLFGQVSQSSQQSTYNRQHQPVQQPLSDAVSQSTSKSIKQSRKRPSDADTIYDTVKKPYPYTAGFHRLLHYIKGHFSRERIGRIAKALAAIRPSLITFAQGLTDRDLVFMEVGVQRKLYAYDDFIKAYGTPTIIARRDGAIVAASQEFTILTGWTKSVLLGREPNMNVNTSGTTGTNTATTSGRGTRRPSAEPEPNSNGKTAAATSQSNGSAVPPQLGVLIAEIMDQDSVVQFYEDYAKLAFGDPMGTAFRRGKLLKYRTKEDLAVSAAENAYGENLKRKLKNEKNAATGGDGKTGDGISNEAGINALGEEEGMVDSMYCWNVRRDNFEVPQLIVMNFLPII